MPTSQRRGGLRPQACARCRQQKLKCDAEKPCIMCLRAGATCQPRKIVGNTDLIRKHSEISDSGLGLIPDPGEASSTPRFPQLSTSPKDVYVPSTDAYEDSHPVNGSEGNEAPYGIKRRRLSRPKRVHHVSASSGGGSAAHLASTSSAMRFAYRLLEGTMSEAVGGGRRGVTEDEFLYVLVGEARTTASTAWELDTILRPSKELVEALMETYLVRAHWFMLLVHGPSLKARMHSLWATETWQRTDARHVLVILAILAMGALCAPEAPSASAAMAMEQYGCDLTALAELLISEVNAHFLDILGECTLESVQLCMILCRYYSHTGSSGVAWSLVGMASRNAYAAGLHLEPTDFSDPVHNEVRRRVWSAVKMTDVFSAFFFGRPPSLDCNFTYPSEAYHMDDLELMPSLSSHPALFRHGSKVNLLTFHILKSELYEIVGKSLSSFRRFRQDSLRGHNLQILLQSIREAEAALAQWRLQLPPFFDCETWTDDDPLGFRRLSLHEGSQEAETLTLQSHTLQIIFDSTVIMLNRPIIELAARAPAAGHDVLSPQTIATATDAAVAAALRISKVPLLLFENELAASYILIANLTAAVILCIPPLREPMSSKAHDAKAGILRIVRGCRKLSARFALAENMSRLLSSIMTTVVQQETTAAFASAHDDGLNGAGADPARAVQSMSTEAIFQNGMGDTTNRRESLANYEDANSYIVSPNASRQSDDMAELPSLSYWPLLGQAALAPEMEMWPTISWDSDQLGQYRSYIGGSM